VGQPKQRGFWKIEKYRGICYFGDLRDKIAAREAAAV